MDVNREMAAIEFGYAWHKEVDRCCVEADRSRCRDHSGIEPAFDIHDL